MVCISVATDDGLTVKKGHFGDARFYLKFSRTARGWRLEACTPNPYAGEHAHGEEHGKRERIYELNTECDAIVATFFGPGGREYMENRGLTVVQVPPGTSIAEALEKASEALEG